MEVLDTDKLLQLQSKQIEKEQREIAERLRILAKRVDHFERAMRKEERPLIEGDYEQQKAEDREAHIAAIKAAREAAREKHAIDLDLKRRLGRMMPDYLEARQAVESRRADEFAARKAEAEKKIAEEKAKLRKRVLAERAAEKKRAAEEKKRRAAEEKAAEGGCQVIGAREAGANVSLTLQRLLPLLLPQRRRLAPPPKPRRPSWPASEPSARRSARPTWKSWPSSARARRRPRRAGGRLRVVRLRVEGSSALRPALRPRLQREANAGGSTLRRGRSLPRLPRPHRPQGRLLRLLLARPLLPHPRPPAHPRSVAAAPGGTARLRARHRAAAPPTPPPPRPTAPAVLLPPRGHTARAVLAARALRRHRRGTGRLASGRRVDRVRRAAGVHGGAREHEGCIRVMASEMGSCQRQRRSQWPSIPHRRSSPLPVGVIPSRPSPLRSSRSMTSQYL